MSKIILPNGNVIEFRDKPNPYQSEVCQLSYVTIDGEQWCTTPDEPSVELLEREMEARAKRKCVNRSTKSWKR